MTMTSRSVRALFAFVVVLAGIPVFLRADSPPAAPPATAPTVLPAHTAPFVHPGLFYTADDIAFMRKKIAAKEEPWASAYAANFRGDNSKRATNAVAEWDATKDNYMHADPVTAHAEALQWALTGDQVHADNAIKILNAWSSTLTTVVPHKMPQEMLAIGWDGYHFANAAELLCHAKPDGKSSGWSDADIAQFKKMLALMYPVIQNFLSGYNGNWDASMMITMISMAVFLDDQDMFNRVIQHYAVGQKPNGGILYYVAPSGQCQESGRDQGHVTMGLGNLAAVCEVAKRQGVDLYGLYDNRLMLGFEYTAKYNTGNDDVPFDPAFGGYKQISPGGRGIFAGIYEAPYQHYVYEKGLEMPFTKQVIFGTKIIVNGRNKGAPGDYRPEGGTVNTGICFGTLSMFRGDQK